MKAVILGAGDGTRMRSLWERLACSHRGRHAADIPKILTPVLGQTLLERTLDALSRLGVEEFVLVTGYRADQVEDFVGRKRLDQCYRLSLVHNPGWEAGNARSVLAAKDLVGERFVVAMGDHIFDPQGLQGFLNVRGDFIGVFDSNPRYVDVDEATKAASYRGRVVRLSKNLDEFKYVDVGLFVCSQRVFPVIERCVVEGRDEWNDVKRAWIEEGNDLLIFDCRGSFWLDIDTPEELRRAEELLRQRLVKPRDGLVARYLNRPLSTRLSPLLARTPITPNQVTLASFLLGVLSGLAFAVGQPLSMALGGLLAQASSVVDGCDGEVARLKGSASAYGAWFDAVLDRWADAIILMGMAWGAFTATHQWTAWPLGVLAVAGSIILSYSESRYESAFKRPLPVGGWQIPAKRDMRLFLVMLGGLAGQIALTLGAISALTAAEVARRLLSVYRPAPVLRLLPGMLPRPAEAVGAVESRPADEHAPLSKATRASNR